MQWNEKTRLRIVSIYLYSFGVVLAFWWPLSHWFFSEWYHQLMGFESGTYPDNMVKIIGTNGIVPVLLSIFTASEPRRYRNNIIILLILGVTVAATNIYLIFSGVWPVGEWMNVGISLIFSSILFALYPWKLSESQPTD